MLNQDDQPLNKLHALAAELRAYAAETTIDMFKCKFEKAAAELEEAARSSASRVQSRLAH
jgi:hypothetical protein